MGRIYKISGTEATPTFAHAVETYLTAHTLAGAWADGTTTKYRQTGGRGPMDPKTALALP